MKTNVRKNLDALRLSEVYSLLLFVLYKVQDIPDFATLSEMCYLLDSNSLTRLLTYFAGKTITFPTMDDLSTLTSALLLYQYVNIDKLSFIDAQEKLEIPNNKREKVTNLYLQILPIMSNYTINQ